MVYDGNFAAVSYGQRYFCNAVGRILRRLVGKPPYTHEIGFC